MPGLNSRDFREWIIRPVLADLAGAGISHTLAAENLLLGTAAQESGLGAAVTQMGKPGMPDAFGPYQMQKNSMDDLYFTVAPRFSAAFLRVSSWGCVKTTNLTLLAGNWFFATALARINYFRHEEALPAANDIPGLAAYWKKYWNTSQGAGTVEQFIANYKKLVDA